MISRCRGIALAEQLAVGQLSFALPQGRARSVTSSRISSSFMAAVNQVRLRACPDQQQHVKLIPVRESSMPSSDDQCPTCDGSGFVVRNEQQYPCPTCSPTTDIGRPYLTADETAPSSPFHIARSVAYGLGAAALFAVLALVLRALWH